MSTTSQFPGQGQFEHGQYERVEREFERDPIAKPMLAAVLFHLLVLGGGFVFALFAGLFHRNAWGGANEGSAISVQLVSNALPLPADHTPNNNVLATETPSEAPAPPTPKAQATVDETAIPIASKMDTQKKAAEKKQEASKTKTPVVQPTTKASPHTQSDPTQNNRAQYGEQASTQIQRSAVPANTTTVGSTTVNSSGSRGFNYPYYVSNINRKVQQNTNLREVDARTPHGAQANILFTIRRDGSGSDFRMDRSSGSPTLDQACLRAAQRVDTFGALPSPPGDGPLIVSYHCDYQGP
jgi:periplasmic protein TonB